MTSGHSLHLNIFIKNICQFTGWSELEDSKSEDRSCCIVHTSVTAQSIQWQNSYQPPQWPQHTTSLVVSA